MERLPPETARRQIELATLDKADLPGLDSKRAAQHYYDVVLSGRYKKEKSEEISRTIYRRIDNQRAPRSTQRHRINDIKQKITRIVGAISEGTDTPALRQALLSLEGEKAELEKTVAVHHRPILVEPPPAPELARLFRRKVERLEETLNAEPTLTSKAAPILRTLIDGIVLHPRKKRGTMPIEVYGEPSALFLLANDETSDADNWMITVVAEEGLEPPTRGL